MVMEVEERHRAEMRVGYGIMIACLMIIALGVIYTAMDRLQAILIPFVLSVALAYLLTPLVDLLSCRGAKAGTLRLSRGIAVLISFFVGVGLLIGVGLVLLRALTVFQERSSSYAGRIEGLLESAFTEAQRLQWRLGTKGTVRHANHSASQEASEMVANFLSDVSLTDTLLNLLGTAAHIAEDTMYIVLFLIFMLLSASERGPRDPVSRRVERQIFIYIRGKSSISAFVGGMHAIVLWAVGLQGLWLPFGVLTFFLNFIPNVGGMGAVLLPLPIVALDPKFSSVQSTIAFAVPFCVNIFAKDVLEPNLLGHATDLQPVAILLAILIYGSVWGITGMVMAIPLTAVLRIYLESVDHPVPRYIAKVLAGKKEEGDDDMALGLKWEEASEHQPPPGTKLEHAALASALGKRSVQVGRLPSFTAAEFDSLRLSPGGEALEGLTPEHFVAVDVPGGFLKPATTKFYKPIAPKLTEVEDGEGSVEKAVTKAADKELM